jgi:signal transduction histidine kinase
MRRDRLQEIETMMEVLPIGLFIAADGSATQITGNRAAREFLRMPDADSNLSLSAPADQAPAHFRVFQDGVEIPPQDLPVQRAAREGVALPERELDIVFADGTVRNSLVSALPLLDAEGAPRGAVASVSDITARRAAEKEREALHAREKEARAEAEEANRAKDEFLATISHELRTPLNAILGWTALLADGTVFDHAAIREALTAIERSCRAQAQLIEDLLDFSRIDAGTLRLDTTTVDLVAVVSAAVDMVRPAAEARGLDLRLLLGNRPCLLSGDATRLEQVVWNLLTNAVKFSTRGGSVEVLLEAEPSEAVLTVTDSGEGIAPEFLPHVFDRFRQAEMGRTRRHGGIGLGLAIAQNLVEMHGGTITAASDGRGRGARFTVRLPLAMSASSPASGRDRPATPLMEPGSVPRASSPG